MDIIDVEKLDIIKFLEILSESNKYYIEKHYVTLNNALECYQDGAFLSYEEEYLDINKYFDIQRNLRGNRYENK